MISLEKNVIFVFAISRRWSRFESASSFYKLPLSKCSKDVGWRVVKINAPVKHFREARGVHLEPSTRNPFRVQRLIDVNWSVWCITPSCFLTKSLINSSDHVFSFLLLLIISPRFKQIKNKSKFRWRQSKCRGSDGGGRDETVFRIYMSRFTTPPNHWWS